jgi:hypothetical protein
MSFETSMLGSLYLCLVRNVDFGFGAPHVDVGLAAPSCHSKRRRQVRWPSYCSSCGCWASGSTHRRSILYTLVSFDMRALSFFCPCCSTWRRWVVDTFASSDTSGLGSPDVFEGGGAGFDSFDEWRVVWRYALSLRSTLRRMAVRLVVWPYGCRLALWLSFGPMVVVWPAGLSFDCWVVVWLLGCRLVAGLSFGPHLAVLVVVWPFSLLFGALL